jgi:glycosyltransferase involved in cell wall biosynthesis
MKQELVSVIINSFNGSKFVEKSINSVLNQTYKNLEIIFWDNASTDDTKQIINNFSDSRLKPIFSTSFKKLYDAKHQAILNSKGKYLAFLDVDDWWNEEKLFKQIEMMELEQTSISSTNYWIVNENKNYIKKALKKRKKNINNYNFALQKYFIGMSSLIISNKLYQSLDYGFDKSFEVIGDYDLVLRILKNNNITYLNEPLSYYRWHDSNLSHRKFRLNIIELIKWRNKLKKNKNFFSSKNLVYINDHIIYLMNLYYKNKNSKINFYLFLKNTHKLKTKILIILVFLMPKKLLKFLRS